jgi:hypothetical protein
MLTGTREFSTRSVDWMIAKRWGLSDFLVDERELGTFLPKHE